MQTAWKRLQATTRVANTKVTVDYATVSPPIPLGARSHPGAAVSGHVRVVPRLDVAQRAHLPAHDDFQVQDRDRPPPGPGVIPGPYRDRILSVHICWVARHTSGRKSVLTNAHDRTTLHQYSQIPGDGDFLPKFLPKQAPTPS